ncbi:MAG: glycerophosphodiester phosphodiesterase [Planctomycetales bacterium]|nr:glycerophosphodiester phosphodiesterase [Planctomycetales bacterium]
MREVLLVGLLMMTGSCWQSVELLAAENLVGKQTMESYEIWCDGELIGQGTAEVLGDSTADAIWMLFRTVNLRVITSQASSSSADTDTAPLEIHGAIELRTSTAGRAACDQLALLPTTDGWRVHPADVLRCALVRNDTSDHDAANRTLGKTAPLPRRSIVIAHRGASGYLPEHTQASACLAYGLGADYVEQDVVLTKESVPIVLHDIHLDTVTDVAIQFPNRARPDGRYYALDFTWDEIKTLQVHERTAHKRNLDGTWNPVFPERFPVGKSSFRLSSLSEMIELIQGLNHSTGKRVGIYPELKHPSWHRKQGYDLSKVTLQMLTEFGYRDHGDAIYVQCFEPEELKRIRTELKSELPLIQLIDSDHDGDQLWSPAGLAEIGRYADAVGPSLERIFTVAADGQVNYNPHVATAHSVGLVVHPWTLRTDSLPDNVTSTDKLMEIIRHADLDGFFSDFPDRTRF